MIRRKRNILLVEPPYKSSVLPFSLQKFATYHLTRGDRVRFTHSPFQAFGVLDTTRYHKIYITSVFTYYGQTVIDTIKYLQRIHPKASILVGGVFASLMPEVIEKHTGIKPHVGLYHPIEDQLPDFSVFPEVNEGHVFTSRGCIHKCEFCAVSKIEPKMSIVKNWKGQIQHIYNKGIRHLCIQDNNFFASPRSHQKKVMEFLSTIPKMSIDFNQALEARLFKNFHAKLILKHNMPVLRFAFDGMHEDGYFQDAVARARKHGYTKRIVAYILYNFTDTPADFYYRLMEAFKLGCSVHPMRYAPIDRMTRKYTGEHWTREMHTGISKLLNRVSNIASSKEYPPKALRRETYYQDFGRNAQEFIEMISHPDKLVSAKHFANIRESEHLVEDQLGFIDKTEVKKSRKRALKTGAIIKRNFNQVKGDYQSNIRRSK